MDHRPIDQTKVVSVPYFYVKLNRLQLFSVENSNNRKGGTRVSFPKKKIVAGALIIENDKIFPKIEKI